MADEILEVKRALERIAKIKDVTRIESYNLMIKEYQKLNEKEKELLIKEYRREYAAYDEVKDVADILAHFMSGIGMLIAVFGIFFEEAIFSYLKFQSVIYTIAIIILAFAGGFSWIYWCRISNLNRIRYILDIIEKTNKG